MIYYRCTYCGRTMMLSAVDWQAHRLAHYDTHRGPARYTNDPSQPARPAWITRATDPRATLHPLGRANARPY